MIRVFREVMDAAEPLAAQRHGIFDQRNLGAGPLQERRTGVAGLEDSSGDLAVVVVSFSAFASDVVGRPDAVD